MSKRAIAKITISRSALKDFIKNIIREELDCSTVTTRDINEVMSKIGSNLTDEEAEMLYQLNLSIKQINEQAFIFADKETNPGVMTFVIDASFRSLYLKVNPRGDDCFDLEVLTMKPEFQNCESGKRFSDLVQSSSKYSSLTYSKLMNTFTRLFGERPLLERFQRMKAVLNG